MDREVKSREAAERPKWRKRFFQLLRAQPLSACEIHSEHAPQADIGESYWGNLYGEGLPGGTMKEADKEVVNKVLRSWPNRSATFAGFTPSASSAEA